MEPAGSLPLPQQISICPFPEPALGRYKTLVQVRGFKCEHFVTRYFLRRGVLSTTTNPQTGPPPLVGCPRLLIHYIRSYLPYCRPFLHPQPEDAPCRGDRDPLITAIIPLPNVFSPTLNSFRSQQNYANAPGLLRSTFIS